MPELVDAGVITGPHGIVGEVKFLPLAGVLDLQGRTIELQDERHERASLRCEVERARPHKRGFLIKFKGCDTRNAAEELRGYRVMIPEDALAPLGPDEYLIEDIIGLKVYTVDGELLGEVEEVMKTGANDVYVIGKYLIPAIHDVVREIDPANGRMVIEPLEGMI